MASFAGGKIEAYAGPAELGAPDDLEAVIVEFVHGARQSLDIAIQELDSEPIAQAVLDARFRGVSVRMVLEQDYLLTAKVPKIVVREGEDEAAARRRVQWSDEPGARSLEANRRILAALLRCGVDVKADYNPAIFHQKFIVRDFREKATPTSAILSGSANFTGTDCHRNLNHVVIFHDVSVCREYAGEFERIRAGRFGRGEHGKVPAAYNVGGVPVKVLFAPDHAPELEIMKQMLKARRQVDFAIFTFAGSSGIDDAMIALAEAGRTVSGAMDPGQGAQKWAATHDLDRARIEIFFPKRAPGFGKLHHKLMVIDDSVVIAGSFNYTAPANNYNDENIFVLGSPYPDLPRREGGPRDAEACAALAGFFRQEIRRIQGAGERFTA
ncbi:phosphatidylserine/phosphatidylglycerophosphate/cardiolipin synthase-like enzyme [Thermocatellispora tengchongensis]|uniref:phospholipase D n=1 Tax=Thermocatellispora tengchongensis TaxID=1073253 RepID=A0A840PG26_9ACTN|nr:phospholipase D-like domain-containing protein [Thermocatellispora tengchongensis]MBB5140364.1 phosphatidylserine/phosphatidylglycerophosphate/cardiolipin synthase-like enzyme [Thermocatellispora tengchongensis]